MLYRLAAASLRPELTRLLCWTSAKRVTACNAGDVHKTTENFKLAAFGVCHMSQPELES